MQIKYIVMYKYNIYFTFKYPLKLYIVLIYIYKYCKYMSYLLLMYNFIYIIEKKYLIYNIYL